MSTAETSLAGRKDVKPKDGPEERVERVREQYRIWGQLASFIVMILALFAFGLHAKDGHIEIRWDEVPAILIVFLLAELGVHLVADARAVSESVKEANESLQKASWAAKENLVSAEEALKTSRDSYTEAERALEKSRHAAESTLGKLDDRVDVLGGLVRTSLWYDVVPRFNHELEISGKRYWKSVEVFSLSWLPEGELGANGKRPLIGALFELFVGATPYEGSVRITEEAVTCVTADSVFAKASKEWLQELRGGVNSARGEKLRVWAVTTLLPTQFAFPGLWWGEPEYRHERFDRAPIRTQVLEEFVESVLGFCNERDALLEYKRLTVFESQEFRSGNGLGPSGRLGYAWIKNGSLRTDANAKEVLDETKAESVQSAGKGPLDLEGLRDTLEGWFVFDECEGFSNVVSATNALCGNFGLGSGALNTLNWTEIRKEFGLKTAARFRRYRDKSVLPCGFDLGHDGVGGKGCAFFTYEASSGFQSNRRRILACSLDITNLRKRLLDKCDEFLASFAELRWISLKEWYTKRLHYPEEGSAWWSCLKGGNVLEPFKLDWNGNKILTLDLILFGVCSGEREKCEEWKGAAISNLSSDRSECTIQVVTGQRRLEMIADAVRKISCDFGSSVNDVSDDVAEIGKWDEWPISSWPRQ